MEKFKIYPKMNVEVMVKKKENVKVTIKKEEEDSND